MSSASSPSPRHSPSITRTVAIIKNHALHHRFDIERRIQESSFEIVKERQMEFDTETDPDTLFELFGEDAESFSEGPVWVYVLERRRAVEVWNTLMGPKDPEVARHEVPNSLRALYGISANQNGIMGSPNIELAEIQIASLFVSSPPFPTTELPADEMYAHLNTTPPSTVSGRRSSVSSGHLNLNGKPLFRARPIPAAILNPEIVPRTTKAAALRAGLVVEKAENGPRAPLSKEQTAKTFLNVPGHKRAETITVASTAAPTIAPRMSKAAALRMGQLPTTPPSAARRSMSAEDKQKTFEGVPGHKRRESISVASTKAPVMAPRLNKSAALRVAQKEQGTTPPPSSFRGASASPIMSRTSSVGSSNGAPRPRSSLASNPRTPVMSRSVSALGSRPSLPANLSNVPARRSKDDIDAPANGEAKKPVARPRPSSVMLAPSITPRTNKSAALRAAKKEMEAQAAAAAAAAKSAKKPVGRSMPPSSFKAPPVAS